MFNLIVYNMYVRHTILYGSGMWYLREKKVRILRRTERVMVRATCDIRLIDRKRVKNLL